MTNSTERLAQLVIWATAISAGMFFGWSVVCVNTVLAPMRAALHLSGVEVGFVVGAVPAGALVGCLLGAKLIDALGMRRCLVGGGALAAVGAAAAVVVADPTGMIAGRAAIGLALGLVSAATPAFVAARSNPKQRAVLLTGYQLAATVGILVAFCAGWLLDGGQHWRLLLALNGAPAVLLVVFALMCGADAARDEQASAIGQPSTTGYRLAIVIAIAASLMNALTGVNMLMFYSTDIFGAASHALPADVASLTLGAVNTAATVVAILLVNRLKRRTLLTTGLVGMSASLTAVAAGLMFGGAGGGIIAVAGSLTFVACFAISVGPLAWVLVAEFAPPAIAGAVTSAAVAANWAANMALALLFPMFAGSPPALHKIAICCVLFAALGLVFLVFVRRTVPETSGLSLDEIRDTLARKKELAEV